MALLPLDELGARVPGPGSLAFGVLLPWVSPETGHQVRVKVIHERDQFLQDVPPHRFDLAHSVHPSYGDRWDTTIRLDDHPPLHPRSAWGQPGTYIYRYEVQAPSGRRIDWVCDPFGREFGVGKLSAVTLGGQAHAWSASEAGWRVPAVEDLVIYELMLAEFARDLDQTVARLDYLADLGVNCLEVMPVSNVAATVDWGFLPIGYFGLDDRFGRSAQFQRFVDEAHQRGIAVILDAVYGHTSDQFPYSYLYRELGQTANPFLGSFGRDYFGESTDFRKPLVQDFFLTVNAHWLSEFHVDGFRYDCVPCYWDGVVGKGYANLVYQTHELVESKRADGGPWQRFFDGDGPPRVIQCAEQLEAPVEVLAGTYTNAAWQNGTLDAARQIARGDRGAVSRLGASLGLQGYPREATSNGVVLAKAGLQYVESHDHERLLCSFGLVTRPEGLLPEGDRSLWYKLQPYLIGMLTAVGVPMLWQGQELGENYFVPNDPPGARVGLLRPVHWEYFYDEAGQALIRLVRRLLAVRRRNPELRHGSYELHDDWDLYQSKGVLLFTRRLGDGVSVVGLNLTDESRTVPFAFPLDGDYTEALHGFSWPGIVGGAPLQLELPSNYGRIWTTGR
jgi:1,4-alpha-glucan branching enzyme